MFCVRREYFPRFRSRRKMSEIDAKTTQNIEDSDKARKDRCYNFWRKTLKGAKHVVAPMVDQSELPWRLLCRNHGAQLCYSPMFHSAVFLREPIYQKEALDSCPEDRPLIIQFCANTPENFLAAASIAQHHCDAIDLNLGCPQHIAKRGHYGAYLQEDWDLIYNIVNLASKTLSVPVTAKIRILDDLDKSIAYAKMLERAGCSLLTVHGRTREMKGTLTGLADWHFVKKIKESLSIPVFSNGNIQYFDDVDKCLGETGVDGIMSAEGILHNPALFEGRQPPIWEMAEEYLDLVKQYPTSCHLSTVRGHLFKLWHKSLSIHVDLRDQLATAKSIENMAEVSRQLRTACEKEAASGESATNQTPHWICQPYFRPSQPKAQKQVEDPSKTVKTDKRKHLESMLKKTNTDENLENLSMKQLKRKLKHKVSNIASKKPREIRKNGYDLCQQCKVNPKGQKCSLAMCKACCRNKTYHEVLDCPGHRFMIRSKQEKRESKQAPVQEKDELTSK